MNVLFENCVEEKDKNLIDFKCNCFFLITTYLISMIILYLYNSMVVYDCLSLK